MDIRCGRNSKKIGEASPSRRRGDRAAGIREPAPRNSREDSIVMSFGRYRGCFSEMTKVTYFWLAADIGGLALNWLFVCNMFFQFDFYRFAVLIVFFSLKSTVLL